MAPFKSIAQQKFMHANHPEIAKKWDKETNNFKSLPMRVSNKRNGGYAGIHIKKKNIGKFTATKEKTGETTEELTHSKNPITKKRAIFAQNAKRWSHKNKGGAIRSKMAKYAIGGEVDGEEKEKKKIKMSEVGEGTGEEKEKTKSGDLKLYEGTMTKEDSKNMIVDGKPYTGKVYTKKEKPTPSFIERKADGGEVEGEGTATSDSVPAKVKKGSFIIPVSIKNKLKKLLSKKAANLNQGGGMPVNLSKGEQILQPNDAKKIDKEFKRNGIKQGINILAPKARTKFSRKNFVNK